MYNLFAFWVCINFFIKKSKKIYLFLALFFIISALLTSARIIFILSFLSIVTTILILIKSNKIRVVTLLFTSLVSISILVTIPSFKQKFNQFLELEKIGFDRNNYSSLSSRFGKIEASLEVIKNNLWFGTGTGDNIDELVKEYREMKFVMGYKYRYNPHNQYLDNMVRNGLIGGSITLIVIYILPIVVSFRRKDFLMLTFILIICSVSLTESILNVQKGITFYVFFVILLLHKNFQKGSNLSNKIHDTI
ncbi:O-antigen ligase family protein [Formosa maritima]|nr:O-antigen ligase family protein [Formosa maritima]